MKTSTVRAMESALSTLRALGIDPVTAAPIALLSQELANFEDNYTVVAWMAHTGTAGRDDGCDRPFWQREDALAYVRKHGGYVQPLTYAAPNLWLYQWTGENPDGPTAA